MSNSIVAIVAGASGGLALVILAIALLCFCTIYFKNRRSKNSDSGSSDPSAQAGGIVCGHKARKFSLEELAQATKNFSEHNLIGKGSFGLVYKGLLSDGTYVAIKQRRGFPTLEFVEEVHLLAEIWHRNLVILIGYCQEAGLQMLVYENLPNGSISGHLYDTRKDSTTKLEFKQRLSVAIGAAKGLSHLHSLMPPLVHKDFKTSNVLVDENFIAKVADAGIATLLQRIEDAGPSQTSDIISIFRDPQAGQFGALSETSDVYSFGVFLLEVVTGQEAQNLILSESRECLSQWVKAHLDSNEVIDQRLNGSFTAEGIKEFVRLTMQCLEESRRRPKMSSVVSILDRILETEMALTTVRGDGSATVTLGSQLFTSA